MAAADGKMRRRRSRGIRWSGLGLAVLVGVSACAAEAPAPDTSTQQVSSTAPVEQRLDDVVGGYDFSGAVLVARGDEVLLSQGHGLADAARGTPNGASTRFRIGSVTKQFTGAAILLLQQDGELSVADRACTHLTICPAGWQRITIEQLLTHTSGIPEVTEQPQFEVARGRPTTPEQQLAWVRGLPLDFPPGTSFRYSNSGYLLLGLVIERLSGQSYSAFLQARIFGPLGMSDSGYDTGADGVAVGYSEGTTLAFPIDMVVPFAAGGLYSTVEDLHRWQTALVGGRVLDAAGTAAMLTSHVDDTERSGYGYSYGVFVSLDPAEPLIVHDGGIDGFAADLTHNRDTRVTVALLSNHEDGPDLDVLTGALMTAVGDR